MKGLPVRMPTNIAIAVGSGMIAMGNPGNRVARTIGPSVGIALRSKVVRLAHPASRGGRHTLRNLCHSLVGGVIINYSRKCGGRLRLININCHIAGANRLLSLSLNCARGVCVRLPGRIGIRAGTREGGGPLVVLRSTSGRLLKRVYTGVHSFEVPRPCGNGNVGFINRRVHEGSNGSTNGWSAWARVVVAAGRREELGVGTNMHNGVSKAPRHPHLAIFEDGGRVCTRIVSSAANGALTTTSSLGVSIGTPGGRVTTGIKRRVTGITRRTNMRTIIFSHGNCLCRKEVGRLTSTTHGNNLGFW